MEPITIAFAMSTLMGVVSYLLKMQIQMQKDQIKELQIDIKEVREKYYKKEDFQEFKKELWARLDRLEDDFKKELDK